MLLTKINIIEIFNGSGRHTKPVMTTTLSIFDG